ncbi:hypothetical protein BUALT_Bualt08G0015100 [Buddleja alternifolia]|uniref:Uncharacterized protein n=1 Tax=Buddleja alternifolia TaxID=168488 RepID=A0AAV6XA84_9LAMI|nr:hypothetical protein BUALT_Bualt08G0015100 [Buddleja alternifolia]
MVNKIRISCCNVYLLASIALNVFFIRNSYLGRHGIAYLDGFVENGKPICECNTCYAASDCSVFTPDCAADADGIISTVYTVNPCKIPMYAGVVETLTLAFLYVKCSGNPLFLEPFWMQHAASSAVLVTGWHRMGYTFSDKSFISQELEHHIRRVHAIARNAVTKGKYIVFGVGSTQLLGAAVFALSMNTSSPASVVATAPYYPVRCNHMHPIALCDFSLIRLGIIIYLIFHPT